MADYREQLTAPLSWWVSAAIFGGICGWIMIVAATPAWGVVAAIVSSVTAWALVWAYGGVTVRAGADGLHVGTAFLPAEFIASAEALDRGGVQANLGPAADARAWLRTRPYVDGGVRVAVADPNDPTPYWLISSRRPGAVVAALGRPVGQTEAAHDEGTPG